MILTYRFRIKNPKNLAEKAKAVNYVWNYCGDVQNQTKRRGLRWLSGFDLSKLLAGSTKELGLHSDTIQDIAKHFAKARDFIKHRPRWRASQGARRALGWIPFQSSRAIQIIGKCIKYLGVTYPVWMHRKIEGRILSGSFAEDSRGRWFVNLQCEVAEGEFIQNTEAVGIDLGLKDFATLSNGEKIENPRHYRREEEALAKAQRAGRKNRTRAIHAKIKNRRKHDLHVLSYNLLTRFGSIFVGNVNSTKLAKTSMAKSVLDAGWSMFRNMLLYKARRLGVFFAEVDESYSTQTCSACKKRSGPRGLEGLGVREWDCSECGIIHDRDINAAQNILFSGLNTNLRQTESLSL